MELAPPDLSIVLPAIRVNRWKTFLDSIDLRKYSYEVIFASPFDPPEELRHRPNVHFLKTYDTPSVATQKGLLKAKGNLIWLTVDDGILFKGAIDKVMDFYYDNCSERDVINCRYREGQGFSGQELPMGFWTAGFHSDLRLAGFQPYWKISLQPLLDRKYFKDLGGIDCRFIYSNHGLHDLAARIQRDGGRYFDSPIEMTSADHMPSSSGDHAPIHNAQNLHDKPIFDEMYKAENYRIKIDINNYKQYEGVWMDRFKKQYQTYEELAREEGYNV